MAMIALKTFRITLALILPLLTGISLAQVETAAVSGKEATASQTEENVKDDQSKSSPATAKDDKAVVVADLTGKSNALIMTAGVCPVVDDFVGQYCTANPDDISCQFQ